MTEEPDKHKKPLEVWGETYHHNSILEAKNKTIRLLAAALGDISCIEGRDEDSAYGMWNIAGIARVLHAKEITDAYPKKPKYKA